MHSIARQKGAMYFRLFVFGGLCVDMWRLVHSWYTVVSFDNCNVARVSYNVTGNTCNITRNTCNITNVKWNNSVPTVYQSSKTVKQQKLPLVYQSSHVRQIHKVRVRVRRIHKSYFPGLKRTEHTGTQFRAHQFGHKRSGAQTSDYVGRNARSTAHKNVISAFRQTCFHKTCVYIRFVGAILRRFAVLNIVDYNKCIFNLPVLFSFCLTSLLFWHANLYHTLKTPSRQRFRGPAIK